MDVPVYCILSLTTDDFWKMDKGKRRIFGGIVITRKKIGVSFDGHEFGCKNFMMGRTRTRKEENERGWEKEMLKIKMHYLRKEQSFWFSNFYTSIKKEEDMHVGFFTRKTIKGLFLPCSSICTMYALTIHERRKMKGTMGSFTMSMSMTIMLNASKVAKATL